MNTPDLFQYNAEKEAAIKQVTENNSPSPLDRAVADALEHLRKLPLYVTCDTIIPDMEQYAFTDNRAAGAVMRKLIQKKAIAPTSNYRPCGRPGNHGRPQRIYLNQLNQE